MHSFKLPYHLLVEEGIFSRIDEVMADVVPNIGQKKAVLVTEENLVNIFKDIIPNIKNDFDDCELYLVEDGYFDDAMALAKHIVVEDIEVVIGFGGGKVLDLAKYASFVSKTMFLCLPTTLSNDSLASPVAVLGTEGKARKTFKCTIPASIIIDVNIIMSAPVKQTLSGIGDTISKYTALNDWKIAMAKDKATVDDFSYMMSKMAFNSICFECSSGAISTREAAEKLNMRHSTFYRKYRLYRQNTVSDGRHYGTQEKA